MTLDLLRKKLRSTKARDLFTKLYGHDPQVVERQITIYTGCRTVLRTVSPA